MDIDKDGERKMDCTQVPVALVLAADDELSSGELMRVETHLAGCVACRDQGATFDQTDRRLLESGELLKVLSRSRPAARAQLMRALAAQKHGRTLSRLPHIRSWRWATVGLAALGLAVAAVWITMEPKHRDSAEAPFRSRPFSTAELSGGTTEVIRAELSLDPIGNPFLDGSESESGMLADVVVGPDGQPLSIRLAD
jgi:anti-sigma factor RsiW